MHRSSKLVISVIGVLAFSLSTSPLSIHAADSRSQKITAHSLSLATSLDGQYWNTGITSLPLTLNYPAVARGHDGNIYVFGGSDTQTYNATYIYHPSSNTWTQGAPMLAPRVAAQAVALPDGRIAVIGGGMSGCDTCVYNTTFVYTPRTNSWIEAAPMSVARERFGATLGHDGRVYAIGGWDGTRAEPTVETFDPGHNAWSPAAGLPLPLEGDAATTGRNGDIVVIGGFNGQDQSTYSFYDNAYVYARNGWKSIAAMPTPREDLAAVPGPDGRIYAIGGFNSQKWVATVEAYDPTTGSWSSVIDLPSPRCCLAAVVGPAGHILVAGGAGTQVAVLESIPSSPVPTPQTQVTVVLPRSNAVVRGSVVRFVWKPYPQAGYYDLQLWLAHAAKGQLIRANSVTNFAIRLQGTSYSLPMQAMPLGVYQWRVAATDLQGTLISPWSPVRTLTVSKV